MSYGGHDGRESDDVEATRDRWTRIRNWKQPVTVLFQTMEIKLEKEVRTELIASVQKYFDDELEQEICEMRAGLLLDFFFNEAGPFAYNKGVDDAERFFREKLEDLSATCFEPPMGISNA